jgi:hypothetical protein
MSYSYKEQRQYVFTEEGQVKFLKIRDTASRLLGKSGAVTCERLLDAISGDSWNTLACLDRLVELGELKLIQRGDVSHHNIYIAGSIPIFR